MAAEREAVIARKDNDRVGGLAGIVQRGENPST